MRFATVFAALLFVASLAASSGALELTVAYTANSSGKLTECGCPGDPYGGLAERVTLMKKLRATEGPFILLDAGNMVSLFGDFDARAACVMRLMNSMGYDAAGVGRQELFHNTGKAFTMCDSAKFPFISATFARLSDGKPAFKRYALVKSGKVTVGVTSLTDSINGYIPEINRAFDYSILPWERELRSVLEEMKGKADFVVVLSQMDRPGNETLLKMFPSVDLVIQGNGNKELKQPVQLSGGYLVMPGDRGQFVGMIRLERAKGGKLLLKKAELTPVLDIPQDKKAMDMVREYYRKRK